MTFDDDFVRLHLDIDTVNVMCKQVGLEWPPPERLWFDGNGARAATDEDPPSEVMIQDRRSEITDEERERMTHVCRGAEYFYASDERWNACAY